RPEIRGMRVRLLGVTASNLGEREQLALFESGEPRHRRAIEATDALRRRYGERAVTRARLLGAGLPAPFERDPRNPFDRRARGLESDRLEDVEAARGFDDAADEAIDGDTLGVTDEGEISTNEG